MSGLSCRMRKNRTSAGPVPNGGLPLAAYATVRPQAKMSAGCPGLPVICSGAM